ncbi:prohormone-1-like [Thrips palmi]|uniref:Prohormone-1-like n=1 Tax=Thrips palmi TaxID=161013 RepID=A0A6P8YTM4_THRPL|nr:prohormone-1-like [Thrips palmi]
MATSRFAPSWFVLLAVAVLALSWVASAQPTGEKERIINELDLMDDDGSVETALMNYLFAKQMVNKLRKEMDVTDLQRKRSYWKQCAFNAVSCFGK